MRFKEATVPILLWVVTAGAVHWIGGEESDYIATLQEGKKKLRMAAQEAIVDERAPMEMFVFDPSADPALAKELEVPAAVESASPTEPTDPPEPDKKKDKEKDKDQEKAKEPEKKAPPPKEEPKKLPELPKKDETTNVKPTEIVPVPPPPPPEPTVEKKISVIQNQKDEEEPNPEADYLSEKNHKVDPKDQTHATITSTTQNDPDPTPGTSNGKPAEKPGNADKTKIAQDDDRPGEKVAPSLSPKVATATNPKPVDIEKGGTAKGDDKAAGKTTAPPTPTPKVAAPEEKSDGKGVKTPQPGAPEIIAGANGGPSVANPASSANPAPATSSTIAGIGDGKKFIPPDLLPKPKAAPGGKWVAGLDGNGPNGIGKLAVNEKTFKAVVGMDELDKLKKVESETQKTKHLGAWKSSSLERWRSAIENYTPGVKPGNQTNLGTAAAPWATYLAQIHLRLHPIFADSFVDSLDNLPATHPLNDKALVTRMEIVMKPDGTLDHLGIVRPSGVTAFDVAALDAVDRAAPFGKAPSQIVSPDGLVYLHWEFHRDDMRCSNINAYPYVLKEGETPKAPEPLPVPKPPMKPGPEEGKKFGMLPNKTDG